MQRIDHGFRVSLCRWAAAAALALFPLIASALTGDQVAYDRFRSTVTGAGKQTVNFGSNGTPVISPGVPTITTDGAAGAKFVQTGSIPNPSGNPVTVTATGRIPNAAIGKTVAAAAGKFIGRVTPWVAWPLAIKELLDEIGWRAKADGTGMERADPTICTVAPCYTYQLTSGCSGSAHARQTTVTGAAVLFQSVHNAACPAAQLTLQSCGGTQCTFTQVWNGQSTVIGANSLSVAPSPAQWADSDLAQLEADIAAKAGWPSGTSKMPAGAEAAAKETGGVLPVQSPTVTGPATSTGKTATTTSTNPDGSTKTTSVTNNYTHNYAGDVITTTTTTTTNITNNGSQGVTATETKTDTPEEKSSECEKAPDRVGCKDLGTPTDEPIPTKTVSVAYTPEDIGMGAGSCPAPVTWSDSLGAHSISYAAYCTFATDVIKPLLLAFAALTCLFILMPGRADT